MDLTPYELNLLSSSMVRRHKAMAPDDKKKGKTNWSRPKDLEDTLRKFKGRGLLDEG